MPQLVASQWGQSLDLSPFTSDVIPQRGIVTATGVSVAAQVVVDEDATDDLIITEFPVEQGAAIHDHAYKRPAEVRVRMGWTNAWLQQQGQSGGDVKAVYEQILDLQATRDPFTVYTGKRMYQNMLIASLRTHTDAAMEFSFLADIEFREVVLVNTQAVQFGNSYGQNMASPQVNSPTSALGPQQPQTRVVDDSRVPVSINLSSAGAR